MVSEDNQQESHDHGEFDQEILAGTMGERRKLKDLSPEELVEEIR